MIETLQRTVSGKNFFKDKNSAGLLCAIKGSLLLATSFCVWMSQPLTVSAQTQDVCKVYTVKRGDSLRDIAIEFYDTDNFSALYSKNRGIIGSNPNHIEVGALLELPCFGIKTSTFAEVAEEGDVATDHAKAMIAVEEFAAEQASARISAEAIAAEHKEQILKLKQELAKQKKDIAASAGDNSVTLLAANDYVPYTDESLAGHGLITEIVEHAILRSNPEQAYEIKFVNDRNSHIDTLLPSFAFEASFPWSLPACEKTELLTENYVEFCENYNFSLPLYDIVEGFIARRGSKYETAVIYDQFEDARICRPEGFPIDHLLVAGVIVDERELIRTLRVEECFEKLLLGTVDVISIDTQMAETIINRLGLDRKITNNKNLSEIKSLHAIAHKDSQSGNALLSLLNEGVTTIRRSGEWYDIASTRLQEQINSN